jgi:cation transport regulator ChaC
VSSLFITHWSNPLLTRYNSEDHRGTPTAPGRVVTLITRSHWSTLVDHPEHIPSERVWGAAYHIPARHVAEVRDYLDLREINGYSIQFTPFHPAPATTVISSPPDSNPPKGAIQVSTTITAAPEAINCLVYIGLPSNPQFVGPQDPDDLARHILRSKGPSGENREYLYMLERGLGELSAESGDMHVSDLVRRCKKLELEEGELDDKESARENIGEPLHRAGTTEEQEEVEK